MSFSDYLSRGEASSAHLDLDTLVDDDDLSALLDSADSFLDSGLIDRDEVDELDEMTRGCLLSDPDPPPEGDDGPPYRAHLDPYASPSAAHARVQAAPVRRGGRPL